MQQGMPEWSWLLLTKGALSGVLGALLLQRVSYQNCKIVEISMQLSNLWGDLGEKKILGWVAFVVQENTCLMMNVGGVTLPAGRANVGELKFIARSICAAGGRHCKKSSFSMPASKDAA